MKFKVIIINENDQELTILEDTLNLQACGLREQSLNLSPQIKRLVIIHDNLSSEFWDLLYIRPLLGLNP